MLLASFYKYYYTAGSQVWLAIVGAVSLAFYVIGFIGVWKEWRPLTRAFVYAYTMADSVLTVLNLVLLPAYLDTAYANKNC